MICRGVYHARQLLEAGVVACRDLGSVNGYALGLRDAICAGSIPGPLVQACGLAVCATGGHGGAIGLECDGADAMTRGVRQIVKAGADVVKIMVSGGVNSPGPEPGPCELTETELQAAVDAAHAMGRKVTIHAHGVTAIRRGIWCGVDSVEHGVFMSEEIMDEMRRRGAYLVPTLSAPYLPLAVGMCVGAGLSEQDGFASITSTAASILGLDARIGSLAPGKDANLAIFNGNPIRDLWCRCVATVTEGQLIQHPHCEPQ